MVKKVAFLIFFMLYGIGAFSQQKDYTEIKFKSKSIADVLDMTVEDGLKLTARGRLSIYENRGDYQLIVEQLEESGVGALQRAFEALKRELAARGWFDEALKRELPGLPRHIGYRRPVCSSRRIVHKSIM